MSGYNIPPQGQGEFIPPNMPPFMFDDSGHKPFRKRHPFIFVLILLLLLAVVSFMVASCMRSILDDPAFTSVYGGKQLGMVNVEGIILESTEVVDWILELEENPNVVGVLVRINSPGGAVTPSEEIYFAIERLAKTKPVVASMSTLAASGGYMIALPAQHIIASPSTITGSIGTRMDMANWGGLMDKIGIKDQSLSSGGMKDAGSPYRDMSAEERSYFMSMLTDMHDYFKELVVINRELDPAHVDEVADGRAYTGRQALELGLVDSLGGEYEALLLLNSLTENEAAGNLILEGPPQKYTLFDEMFGSIFQAWNRAQARASFQKPLFYF